LNAAWRVELPLPAPALPAGGGPEWVVDVPLLVARGGIVTPCCCRHFANAVRLAVVLALADAAVGVDVVVLVLVLVELLPHAAMSRLVASVVRPSVTRRARRWVGLRTVM
jgi:hypothetical protein